MNVAIGKRLSRVNAPEWTAHSTPNPVTRVVSQPDQPRNDQLPAGTLLGTARNHTQASKMAPKVARPQVDVAFWLKPLSSEQLYGPPSVENIAPAPRMTPVTPTVPACAAGASRREPHGRHNGRNQPVTHPFHPDLPTLDDRNPLRRPYAPRVRQSRQTARKPGQTAGIGIVRDTNFVSAETRHG